MNQNRENLDDFPTDQINPAAFIAVVHKMPTVSYDSVTSRVLFSFPDRDLALKALLMYESGGECSAKTLLTIRGFLYKEIARVKYGGRS